MTAKKEAADFNWVKERAGCSLAVVFAKLKAEIQIDVETRNQTLPQGVPLKFEAASAEPNHIVVVKEDGRFGKSVTFRLSKTEIVVSDDSGKPVFSASLTLNDDGECRFKVADKELDSWQFRKRALEELFFVIERRQ